MSPVVESPTQMASRVVAGFPGVADYIDRCENAGVSADRAAVATWLLVYGPDVRAALDSNARVNVLPDDELDAIVEAVAYACAHLDGGLNDEEFVMEFAKHAAWDRVAELAPAAPPKVAPDEAPVKARRRVMPMVAAVLTWTPSKPKPPRTRRVRVCVDVTDSRGRVTVPEDTYGRAMDWPMFGPVTVEFLDRHGRPVRARVLRHELAVVDG